MPTLPAAENTPFTGGLATQLLANFNRARANPWSWSKAVLTWFRVTCLLAIAVGTLSLLALWTPLAIGATRPLLVRPDEALALVFMGFALRMSRLEAYRQVVRAIVRTSKIGLLLIGFFGTFGLSVLPDLRTASPNGIPSVAASICFLSIGADLVMRNLRGIALLQVALRVLTISLLGVCWISLLMSVTELSGVPDMLVINPVLLFLLTAIWAGTLSLSKTPAVFRVLYQGGPETEAAQIMFPLTFLIPILLAIFRHQAESRGWVQPGLGLSVHVLLSAGSMAMMIVWYANRIQSALRLREGIASAVDGVEAQYRRLFQVLPDPVWIFDLRGQTAFRNAAAKRLYPPLVGPVKGDGAPGESLGVSQERKVLSAALFDAPLETIELWDDPSGVARQVRVLFLRLLCSPDGSPASIILVGAGRRETGPQIQREEENAPTGERSITVAGDPAPP